MWSITRRILFVALLVLGGLLGGAPRNAAADIPTIGAWNSSFQISNLGTAPANCTYDIYSNAGGAAAFSQAIASTIPVGGSVLVYTGAAANGGTSIPAGVNSGVVSCDQEVAAVVVFQTDTQRDAYVATKTPAATMFAPAVYKNYYNFGSTIRIQNTAATAQTVVVTIYAPGVASPLVTQNVALAANGSASIEPGTMTQLANNVSYSLKAVGTQPIALNVSLYGLAGTPVAPQVYSYSGFAGGATKVFTPIVLKNYYGYNSSATIQNAGTVTANVKRTFSNGLVETFTIPAGSSVARLDFSNPGIPAGNTQRSSTIESTNAQPLIVIVNQSAAATNRATVHEGLTVADGAKTVVAPSAVKRFYGYNSSISCQNVGTAATPLRVTYSGTAIANKVVNPSLAVGAVYQIYQPADTQLANSWNGTATVNADQNIVCVVNQDQNEAPYSTQNKDVFAAYNGIAKP